MGLLERALKQICSMTLPVVMAVMPVQAKEAYPLLYDSDLVKQEDSVIRLYSDGDTYEVLPGDCLWSISQKLLREGSRYMELYSSNSDILSDPDMIYPGTLLQLQTKRTGFIRRNGGNSGFSMGEYYFDYPSRWSVGTFGSGDLWSNLSLSGDGICNIACLVQDKLDDTIETTRDWEACSQLIRDYVDANYSDSVSDLTFEHYQTEQSEDIYLYAYTYDVDMSAFGPDSSMTINVCAGLRLTDHIQAEFIGFAHDYDIHGAVRYAAASFQEYPSEDENFTVNDNNMMISPEYPWEAAGMFNPFPWVDTFFTDLARAAAGVAREDESARDRLLNNMHDPDNFTGR
ncbi:MAG: LysM peptidoglycan-binding domain-containing protein [Candidatus Gastranaerophilales bacterium]|nr:LysM peptidoglycan-binding domain-containing protein [Candidatus Gastranaerophilales bacterium]